ncbi:hypothetical protein MKQ70_23345 [Chitinophaga sedimenti]|uniref:hypothetical protein n=1 Tax=Chitinophaga sedimenti TaxID=2033606 RepID=UPI002004EC68|nr:hypothetical protein [Chitinophaga sedimenti]MCK7557782.1 hypothetical protein [Chitinophaga sedimenti]
MVLSSSADKSHFSFVKVDGSLQADLYKAMNGEDLPPNAQQINVMRSLYYNNGAISSYWLTYKTGAVQLDVATLRRTRFLKDFFFGPPESFDNGNFKVLNDGTLMAIINNKIYFGAFETAPFATYFGFLGAPVNGRYNVGPMVLDNMTEAQSYILGYDNTRQAFIRFAGRSYIDTTYTVRDSLFNPKNLKMSLVHMERFTDDDMYAFMDSAGIKIKELYFSVNFNSSDIFRARKARTSPLNGRIKANTVWAKGIEKDFYFSADDKIYRYNPLNDEIRQLATDFGGKTVTMIKVLNNGDLMLVGTEGTVTYLDISTGRNGAFIKKIEGIPGSPKDVAVRE